MYNAWLDKKIIKSVMSNEICYFNQSEIKNNDVVGLRLRTEILTWIEISITKNIDNATLIFELKPNFFDNNDAYKILWQKNLTTIEGNTSKALLYGFYGLIRHRLSDESDKENYFSSPDQSLRMINHWDQIDGSVERGYGGSSIFFGRLYQVDNPDKGDFSVDTVLGDPFRHNHERVLMYARMLASIGINAISLNDVNVRGQATNLIVQPYLVGVKQLADIFREFGIQIFLAINWKAPEYIARLPTSDPLNNQVLLFWKKICQNIYQEIPDFGGFVVKADSEGESGPYKYGRTHAQGANMLAEAIKPYNGLIIWRAFVYNSKQDWRDRSTDRAKAAYDNFYPLDGQFADNVILQMKFGPIDFQTEEPLMPLFGALKRTNQIIEFEITAEYLGHQIDVNYVVPQWSKMINFNTQYPEQKNSVTNKLIKENSIKSKNSGFAGVSNIGMSKYWTGNPLALANLYGFGRLCWDNDANPNNLLVEWIRQTFSNVNSECKSIIYNIMKTSNQTFKNYTAPLGVGFMVIPHYHYGVSVNGYEYDQWGTYHFADRKGVGIDRTKKTGTGYASMYSPKVSEMYENINKTPDELLLFFHHVSYNHVLQNGKTLIQTIYDIHFFGYEMVKSYIRQWKKMENKINDDIYQVVYNKLLLQLENAREWKDQVNTYFYRMSGVCDKQGRKIYK